MRKDTKELAYSMFGKESKLSLFGKIVLAPILVSIIGLFMLLDLLFTKRDS